MLTKDSSALSPKLNSFLGDCHRNSKSVEAAILSALYFRGFKIRISSRMRSKTTAHANPRACHPIESRLMQIYKACYWRECI